MIKTTEELKSFPPVREKKTTRRARKKGEKRGKARKFMRIYVKTAPFPVVARAKKDGGKRGRSCVKRSAI